MGSFDLEKARRRFGALAEKMTKDDRKKAEQLIVNKEVSRTLNRKVGALRGKPRNEILKVYRETVVDLYRQGKIPSGRSAIGFMMQLGAAAMESGDMKFRAKVMETLEEFQESAPMYGRYLKPLLERLSAKAGDDGGEDEEESGEEEENEHRGGARRR